MAKQKFHYNPKTLNYERIDNSFKHWFRKFILHFLTSVSLGIALFFVFSFLFNSPREKELINENKSLKAQYGILNKRMDVVQDVLTDIQQRDNNLYRVLYQADPIDESVRTASYNSTSRYKDLANMSNSKLMIDMTSRLDVIAKQLYIQSNSFDEIVDLAKQNELRLQSIPAIQPILNKDLKRTASGFGMRLDPVYKILKFHEGMDFTAPIGTEIFATGNGTVIFTGWQQGYGNTIKIDHGFGYQTWYAHLNNIITKAGRKVTRGEVIGKVGNTGKSTGPHLHYEVRYRGKPVDPRNYYFMDLSPAEYDKMIQISSTSGQVFD